MLVFACFLGLAIPAGAQAILILPFENHSRGSALDWVGESASEGLAAHWRFSESSAARVITRELRYVIRREERVAAFDQLGLPPAISLSHATAIKIGELTGADLLIFGSFEGDADSLTLSAQVLEMRHPHLETPCRQSGPLADLLAMQDRLAADLAAKAGVSASLGAGAGTTTLEAWELYIRGLTAGPSPQQFKYFREATRLDPGFVAPAFQLGRISFQNREYSDAVQWLAKLGPESPNYLEARFLEGIADYHLRQWERAEGAFLVVTATIPLNEAFNNLGVVELRERKRPAALENLQKALEGDPNDTDYAFNLACYYLRAGDYAQAARRFREVLAKKPGDAEAKAALASALADTPADPPERLKSNFEEPNFRQLRLALARALQEKNGAISTGEASSGQPSAAAQHLSRGRNLVETHDDAAALAEFSEAIRSDPANVQAYLDLARLHQRAGRTTEAEKCARRAADVDGDKKDPEAYVLLAKIYSDEGKPDEARAAAREALQRSPESPAARELERLLQVKQP